MAALSAHTQANHSRLVWIDCEMTGLEVDKHRLVEIAIIITENDLKVVDELAIVINQPETVLNEMSEWCQKTFRENGLLAKIKCSQVDERMAEDMVLEFLRRHTEKSKCPLAGNSVHGDKNFLKRYMPDVVDHLHYRIVDVSTIKELVQRWYSEKKLLGRPKKQLNHLALDDIKESIEELRWYRDHFFIKP